jgi:hypothetical protein
MVKVCVVLPRNSFLLLALATVPRNVGLVEGHLAPTKGTDARLVPVDAPHPVPYVRQAHRHHQPYAPRPDDPYLKTVVHNRSYLTHSRGSRSHHWLPPPQVPASTGTGFYASATTLF